MRPSSSQFPSNSRHRRRAGGFTLTETLIAGAIGVIILAAVTTTYIQAVKSLRSAANYCEIHTDGRNAVNQFAKDMRSVYGLSSFSSSRIVVTIPTALGTYGNVTATKTVTYNYSAGGLYRTDSSTGVTALLATNIYQLTFMLYDHVGTNTTVLSAAKGIQVDIKLRKYVISQLQSEDYLSARLDMRNKP